MTIAPGRRVHGGRVAAAIATLAILAGCSSVPTTPPADREARAPGSAPAPVRRGGGYYLDDGPGDSAPPDLDRIADAEPRAEPLSRTGNNPYVVFGREYVPDRSVRPFRQRGTASWYGRKFHGQRTSSGERYDMYGMTAAHPTLPIPSYVRVTNLANGRSVVVRVNDRGPFLHNRVIDLSYTAAYKLGYVEAGSTLVEIETVTPGAAATMVASAPQPATSVPVAAPQATPAASLPGAVIVPPAVAAGIAEVALTQPVPEPVQVPVAAEPGGIYLQLGAFSAQENAESFRARIAPQLAGLSRKIEIYRKDGLYRLHVGPYRDRGDAVADAETLARALDLKPHVVVR